MILIVLKIQELCNKILSFFLNMPSKILDVDEILEKALKCELIDEFSIKLLCEHVKAILLKESNVITVPAPVTVVGDVHGQCYDVLEMFKICGGVPKTNFLFLGDYVDRGSQSVETITLLCAMKLKYPSRVNLIRGNHESRQITTVYGFFQECVRKFGKTDVWIAFTSVFDHLPIAAVVNDRFLAVHGGLSPSIQSLDQLRLLYRFCEIPHEGPIADLVWSDPDDDKIGFTPSPRGAGYAYGADAARTFLHAVGLESILRAHQLCLEGFNISLDGLAVTVWSAPNYCYRFRNDASCLEISENNQMFFNVFGPAPVDARTNQTGNARGGPVGGVLAGPRGLRTNANASGLAGPEGASTVAPWAGGAKLICDELDEDDGDAEASWYFM